MAATATARKASAPKAAPKAASVKAWALYYKGELIATSIWSNVLFFYVKKQPESAQSRYEVRPA